MKGYYGQIEKDTLANNFFRTGGMRARFRKSLDAPELLVANEIYRIRFDLECTGIRIAAGQALRLLITNSAMPDFARNHNTGNESSTDLEFRVAHNKLHHSQEYASRLVIPIIDPEFH